VSGGGTDIQELPDGRPAAWMEAAVDRVRPAVFLPLPLNRFLLPYSSFFFFFASFCVFFAVHPRVFFLGFLSVILSFFLSFFSIFQGPFLPQSSPFVIYVLLYPFGGATRFSFTFAFTFSLLSLWLFSFGWF
jgi:hypothetical protein